MGVLGGNGLANRLSDVVDMDEGLLARAPAVQHDVFSIQGVTDKRREDGRGLDALAHRGADSQTHATNSARIVGVIGKQLIHDLGGVVHRGRLQGMMLVDGMLDRMADDRQTGKLDKARNARALARLEEHLGTRAVVAHDGDVVRLATHVSSKVHDGVNTAHGIIEGIDGTGRSE